jgi:hypothetical protein
MNVRHLIIFFILLMISSLCFSQESDSNIGLGVSLNPTALFSSSTTSTMFLPIGLTNIYIPITIGQKFRIEPEIGIYSQSSESKSGTSTSKNSSTLFRLGFGLLKIHPYEDVFNAYFGTRMGILSLSSTSSYTGSPDASTNEIDAYIGFVVGGEHMLSPHFGIGGEVQLNYVSFGQPERTPAPSTTSDRSQSIITNNAVMFFRWYY